MANLFIVGATILLLSFLLVIFRASGHHLIPSRRHHHWHNVHKPDMKIQHDASKEARRIAREEMIRSHYTRRIKRAERRANRSGKQKHLLQWIHFTGMADREVKLDRRMHGLDPVGDRDAKKRIPKIHPKTGQIIGGIGREGTKASHVYNPRPKKAAKPVQKKSSGGKLRKIIVGEPKPIVFKGRKK